MFCQSWSKDLNSTCVDYDSTVYTTEQHWRHIICVHLTVTKLSYLNGQGCHCLYYLATVLCSNSERFFEFYVSSELVSTAAVRRCLLLLFFAPAYLLENLPCFIFLFPRLQLVFWHKIFHVETYFHRQTDSKRDFLVIYLSHPDPWLVSVICPTHFVPRSRYDNSLAGV